MTQIPTQPIERETRWLGSHEILICVAWPKCRLRADRLIQGTSYCPIHGRKASE